MIGTRAQGIDSQSRDTDDIKSERAGLSSLLARDILLASDLASFTGGAPHPQPRVSDVRSASSGNQRGESPVYQATR